METKTTLLLDSDAVISAIEKDVQDAGSQAAWCVKNRVSTSYLSDVLKGRREPGKKILDILGLESVTYYRKKVN